MKEFIPWLESLNEKDSKVRAALKRSLAFDPGAFVDAYPYIEPFLKGDDRPWRRKMCYLVAGVWAAHWRDGRSGAPLTIGKACAEHQNDSRSTSTERRFITLLDSDPDQLPNRLRQMVALLKERVIDFDHLLNGLLNWNDDKKRTQSAWAQDFYRNLNNETATENQKEKEISE